MTSTAKRSLVLLVEDEPAIADIQRLYLQRDGFDVGVVTSGEQALDVIRARRPAAVVLDVGLPGIDGIEVVRRLRAAGDDVPVLADPDNPLPETADSSHSPNPSAEPIAAPVHKPEY